MNIPFADIKRQYDSLKEEVQNAINEVLNDTAFIRGKYVNRFEENFSKMYGIKNVIGVGNGTDAIYLALRALDIGPGDEVITSGGIIGIVDKVHEDDKIDVVLCDNVKVQVIKSTITSLLKKEAPKK